MFKMIKFNQDFMNDISSCYFIDQTKPLQVFLDHIIIYTHHNSKQ